MAGCIKPSSAQQMLITMVADVIESPPHWYYDNEVHCGDPQDEWTKYTSSVHLTQIINQNVK